MGKTPLQLDAIAARLGIPESLVVVVACPSCDYYVAAGYLAPGTYLEIRCPISRCAHHVRQCPYTMHTMQRPTVPVGTMPLLLCPGDLCMRPWSRNGMIDRDAPNYGNGKPVCRRPWARGFVAPGSRLLIWCSQTTCINHSDGFILAPSQEPIGRTRR